MKSHTEKTSLIRRLMLGGAVAASLGCVTADAQVVRDVPAERAGAGAQGRRTTTQWSFDLRATYSDNFRRIDDERLRGVILLPTDGVPSQTVVNSDINPPNNVIFSASLRGGSVYERPGLTGIVQGGVTATINADNAPLDERLAGTPLPDALQPGQFDGDVIPLSFGLPQEQELFIRPDIAASATARVVDQLFYVDASAVAQQQIINQRQAVAIEADGQLGDVTTFVGGSISPYLTRRFGNGSAVEARYRLSGVVVADEQFEPGDGLDANGDPLPEAADDQRFANDSIAQEAILEFDSGQFFDRIDVVLRATAAQSEETGSELLPEVELTRLSAESELAYDVGRSLSVTGSIGYDDITVDEFVSATDPALDAGRNSELSGVFWSVGAEYAPTRRSRFALSVGERFGGTQIRGQLVYRPTPRLSVTGQAQRDLQTGTQQGLQGAIGLNGQTLQIVQQLGQAQTGSSQRLLDRVVGFRGGFSNIQQQNFGVQLSNTFSLNASYAAQRTDFGLGVTFVDSEFGQGPNQRDNRRFAVQGTVNRTLSRRATVGVSARYERITGILPVEALAAGAVPDQTSDQFFVSTNASYALGPRFALTARAYRAVTEGSTIGFGIAREYQENAVSAGIRWTF